MNLKGLSLMFAGIFAMTMASARDVMEVQSSYLGEGRFEYRVRTLNDPFIKNIHLGQLMPWPFTNYVESIPPAHWTNFFEDGNWYGIRPDNTEAQTRIKEIVFQARSSFSNFRRKKNGLTTGVYIEFTDLYYFPGGGIGGYINLDCLIPCSPDEADGSASNIVSSVELIRDMTIDQLIHTNGAIHGLTFSWDQQSTVQLEASHDLNHWTPIARFFGDPPRTTWTTNASLNPYGSFFRLSLVANRHLTNSLSGAISLARSSGGNEIPIQSQQITDGKITVGFASTLGTRYVVTYDEWAGKTETAQQVAANSTFTSVTFDLIEPQRVGFFRVRALLD